MIEGVAVSTETSGRERRPRGGLLERVRRAVGDPAALERHQASEIAAVPYLRWVADGRGGWRLAGDYLPPVPPA